MTDERKAEVNAYLNRAIVALLDAQIEMLKDYPPVFPWNVEQVLGPELAAAYKLAEQAESNTIDAYRKYCGLPSIQEGENNAL